MSEISNPGAYSPSPKVYLLIDGDGPREIIEADLAAHLIDVVLSNDEVTFKRKEITIGGIPMIVIEVE